MLDVRSARRHARKSPVIARFSLFQTLGGVMKIMAKRQVEVS